MPDEIKMTIRLVPDLHARLSAAAERDRRSKHAQMLVYIQRGLDQDQEEHDQGEGDDGVR
jgi:predicted transcriptional regulator